MCLQWVALSTPSSLARLVRHRSLHYSIERGPHPKTPCGDAVICFFQYSITTVKTSAAEQRRGAAVVIVIVIFNALSSFFRRDAPRKRISGFLTETGGASARDAGLLVVPPSALVVTGARVALEEGFDFLLMKELSLSQSPAPNPLASALPLSQGPGSSSDPG